MAAAVIGCLDKDGHKALIDHIKQLQAIADGVPPSEAAGYTGDEVIEL